MLTALREAINGTVSDHVSDRLSWAHDASHYLLTPRAVVTPRDAADVAAVLRLGRSHRVPLTFRSGGTSLSGQATSDGLLIDTRKHFRRIEVLNGGMRVRVQPGATVRAVNAALAPYRRKLGPDPASEVACTVGGVVANNSSGMACGIVANTYQTLDSAVFVLPSGTVLDTADPRSHEVLRREEPVLHDGLLQLRDRVRANPESLATIARLYAIKNTMGYGLNSFVDRSQPLDTLELLVVGSEGTLAFVAEATFRTLEVPQSAATGLLVFESLRAATASLPDLVEAGFATIELMDSTSLRVAQRDPVAGPELRHLDVAAHAALLVEFQEDGLDALEARTTHNTVLLRSLPLASKLELTTDPARRAAMWGIRKGLYTAVAGARPPGTTALLEDVAVPVRNLLQTCEALTAMFDDHGYQDSVIFGHAKDGNIHFLLNERFDQAESVARYQRFTDDMVDLVLGQGGTLKAEHGTGRIMAPYVRRQYGDELYEVMLEVKRLFDPDAILNPGILLSTDPDAATRHLKPAPTVEAEVDRCVECGYCEPVCPSGDLTTTPRRRIALRREMALAEQRGDESLLEQLENEYEYDGIETCAADGMCKTACPVLIDTGDLVRRLRAERAGRVQEATWGSASRHWDTVTRAAGLALTAAQSVPPAIPVKTTSLLRRVGGDEAIPQWTPDLPAGGKRREPRRALRPIAVYFPACVSTMFGSMGPGVTDAFTSLCAKGGVEVRTPDSIASLCCGTPWKSKGLRKGHQLMASAVRQALWEATEEGSLPVLVDASSCAEGLVEMLETGDTPMTVVDVVAWVDSVLMTRLTIERKLKSLALHPTCSTSRLGIDGALRRVAYAIADEVVVPDAWGCCAFAGDRGMLHPELTRSATLRQAAELKGRSFDAYASCNRTCELGMSRAVGEDYQHVLELLDRAAT